MSNTELADTGPDDSPLFLSDADVERLADWVEDIEAVGRAYARPIPDGAVPERVVARTATGWHRVMAAASTEGDVVGSKSITVSNTNGVRASYLITLFSQTDSRLLALLDGNAVTGIRTAAASANAVRLLSRTPRARVGVVGSGFEAKTHLRAISRVVDISEAWVTSPTQANKDRFAREMSEELGIHVSAAATPPDAVRDADIIICAARSRDETPTIQSEWVSDQALVVSIGSTTASQRELDHRIIGRANLIVADSPEEVLTDSGDMLAARQNGIDPDKVTTSLNLLLVENIKPPSGLLVYKSTGSGLQDIALAHDLYLRALKAGIGTQMASNIRTVGK